MEIELRSHQVRHFEKLVELLDYYPIAIDKSATGAGKTVISLKLAQILNLKPFIIAPPIVHGQWKQEAEKYGVKIISLMSYEKMRGSFRGFKHPYLEEHGANLLTTDDFSRYLSYGVLLIFDEFQKLKNANSRQSKASIALSKAVLNSDHKSKIVLLSGLPFDNERNVIPMLRLMGFLDTNQLVKYNVGTNTYDISGMLTLIDNTRKFNPNYKIQYQNFRNARFALNSAITIFQRAIIPKICSFCDFKAGQCKIDLINGYYNLDDQLADQMRSISGGMQKLIGEVRDTIFWSSFNKMLKSIETIKLTIIVRLAKQLLNQNNKSKLIIYVWYIDSIKHLKKELKQYHPKLLYGSTATETRHKTLIQFQEPNTNLRLIISNPTVGGEGVNLDDTHGDFPRTTICIPNYRFSNIHQAAGRTYRTKTQSNSKFILIYSKVFGKERKIFESLCNKTKFVNEMFGKSEFTVYPGDYTNFEEI